MVTRFAWLISSLVCERRHNLRLYGVWDSMFMVLYQACLFFTWYWGEWISAAVQIIIIIIILIIIIIILTYYMVQSPSWEAKWFAASQEIPLISRNPKVHYRTHKHPPPVSILGQPNPIHIPKSHLLEIHPNIIHPSTLRSPQWFPSLRFPQQDPIHPLS